VNPPFAIWLCGIIIITAIAAISVMYQVRAQLRQQPAGRHARDPFTGHAGHDDTADPDGSIWLRALHNTELPGLPAAGPLPMLPPDPPPADTVELPIAVCELGMTVTEYVDMLMEKYTGVTA
jgi:hypothetical protein